MLYLCSNSLMRCMSDTYIQIYENKLGINQAPSSCVYKDMLTLVVTFFSLLVKTQVYGLWLIWSLGRHAWLVKLKRNCLLNGMYDYDQKC